MGSILGSRRSPGGGHRNPLWYSCLENPMDGEPGGVQSRESAKSRTRLSELACTSQVQCPAVYINRIFFIRSPVDGHLRCSHALAVVNRAALNVGAHVSFFKMHLTLASSWTYHASCKCRELQFLFYFKNIYLFGCARPQLRYSGPLVAAFGILLPNQGSNSGPLHLERGVLAARPPGKSWATCMLLN